MFVTNLSLFVKPTISKGSTKSGKDKGISCTMSLATKPAKNRKIQGLSPHVTPPPYSEPSTTSMPVPAASSVGYSGLDIRQKQESLRQLQSS